MYAKLLADLDGIRDRAIFLIACFYVLRLRSDLGMLHQQWFHYREHILDLDGKAETGSIQWNGGGNSKPAASLIR
jgi:hypothetical protein